MKKTAMKVTVIVALLALVLFAGTAIGNSIGKVNAADPVETIATTEPVTTEPSTEPSTETTEATAATESTATVPTETTPAETEPTAPATQPTVPTTQPTETTKPQETERETETEVPTTQPEVDVETEGSTEAPTVPAPTEETTQPTEPEETVHKHNHVCVSTVKATCTTKGYSTYKCDCGDRYESDYVEATAHNYNNGMCTGCGAKDPNYQEPTEPETQPETTPETEPSVEEHTHDHSNCTHHVEEQIGSYTYVYCECIDAPYRDGKVIFYPYSFYY